jgi:hypothetical protein
MVGTAPGARIWSVKVVNDMGHIGTDEVGMSLNGLVTPGADLKDGNAKMSDAIAGINWVTINSSQIEVANMSFACATDEWGCARTALAEAIATSVNNGVVWVAAAGHEGMGVTDNSYGIRHYPALLSDVITVSAMADYDGLPGSLSNSNGCPLEKGFQHDDRLMWEGKEPVGLVSGGLGSNYGPEVDMTAPGSCVFSTWSPYASGSNAYGIPGSNPLGTPTGSEYGFMYGSSVASGLVAGAAADIAARSNPNNRADVENIRAALLGAGNYNWEDLVDKGVGLVSPDGSKEPLLSLDGLTSVPSPPSPVVTPPTVTMGAVSNVTESSATISGTVNPNGHDGRYKFVCGRSGYSLSMVSKSEGTYFPTGTSPINVSWTVSGLYPGASYYCHLAAWNIGNIENPVYSPAANFTTPLAAGYVAAGAPAPLRVSDGSIHVFTRLKGVGDELNFTRATSGMWTAANLTPAGQPKMGNSSAVLQMKNGAMHAFAINTAGDIVAYYRTGSEPWNYINLSAYAGATLKFDKTTTPSAVEWGPNRVGVYARAVNGDLVSLERTAEGSWFMWNESEKSVGSHPTIVGSPAAVVTDGSSAYANTGLIVFARNASNQLISFNCNAKGEWIPYNVSANTGMSIKASPSAIVVDPLVNAGSVLSVYAPNTSDELVEFNRAASGMWTTYNVTKNIPGGPTITGSAAPIRLDPSVHADSVLGVYARTTDNDLVGFDRKTNGAWYFYNVSAYNSYPKISSSPAVLSLNPANYFGSVLQVHARSTSDDLLSFDRKTNGGWLFYNETFNVPGNLKVE